MKSLYFPQKLLKYFFCDSCFYATVHKFRLLDYVACKNPGHDIKGLVSVCYLKFISGW